MFANQLLKRPAGCLAFSERTAFNGTQSRRLVLHPMIFAAWFSDKLTWWINKQEIAMQKHAAHVSPRNVPSELRHCMVNLRARSVWWPSGVRLNVSGSWKMVQKLWWIESFFDRRWPTTLTQREAKLSISMRLDCYLYVTDWQEEIEADHGPNGLLMKIRGGWKVNTVTKWSTWSRSITKRRRSGHVNRFHKKASEFCISKVLTFWTRAFNRLAKFFRSVDNPNFDWKIISCKLDSLLKTIVLKKTNKTVGRSGRVSIYKNKTKMKQKMQKESSFGSTSMYFRFQKLQLQLEWKFFVSLLLFNQEKNSAVKVLGSWKNNHNLLIDVHSIQDSFLGICM